MNDRDLLGRLIAFDSVSWHSNLPIADFLAEYLEQAGCRVWRQADDDGQKVNLLARAGPARAGGLLLSGHLDVVPAGEPDWHSDPFKLVERGGRFYGRGTADMKGWVALAANCLRASRELTRPLYLLLTADEEIGCVGARRFAQAWPGGLEDQWAVTLPTACLVGEPTQMRLVRLHKGHWKARIRVSGRAAHSGYPHLGDNAIEKAGLVLERLRALASEWRGQRCPASAHFPECPYPALNVGSIRGGSAVNIVPESCEIQLGVRLLPGQAADWPLAGLERALDTLPADVRPSVALEVVNHSPPLFCDESAVINRELSGMLNQPEAVGVAYASDAGWLATLGMECVLLGPGDIGDAHRANESIDIAEWQAGGELLRRIVRRFCGEDARG